jgi:hypothetical protein
MNLTCLFGGMQKNVNQIEINEVKVR